LLQEIKCFQNWRKFNDRKFQKVGFQSCENYVCFITECQHIFQFNANIADIENGMTKEDECMDWLRRTSPSKRQWLAFQKVLEWTTKRKYMVCTVTTHSRQKLTGEKFFAAFYLEHIVIVCLCFV